MTNNYLQRFAAAGLYQIGCIGDTWEITATMQLVNSIPQ